MDNRLIKNASWIIACRIIQSLLSFVIVILSARYLGPANYGLINYASSIVAFVIPIMQLGFRNTMVREFINKPEDEGKVLGTALLMNFITAVLCMAGVIAFVSFANRGETDTIIVCALYSINLIFQALEMSQYWFQAKLLSKYTAVISVVACAVVSVYKIYLLVTGKNIYWFAVSQALDYMLISVPLLIVYKIIGKQKISFSLLKGKELFSNSKHYIVSSMMVAIFGYIGNVFLKFLIDEEAVGFYTVAVTCGGMTSFVFAAIIDSARPAILESKLKNPDTFNKKIIQLYSFIITLTILQGIGISLFAELIVKLLYGSEYLASVVPLRIYTWQTVFSEIGIIRNIWILAEGKQKYLWIINLCGAVSSVILNFILIPTLGPVGAAISAVATQLITNVFIGFVLKPIRENNALLIKSLNIKVLIDIFSQYTKKINPSNNASDLK